MKVLVCGSRTWTDRETMYNLLDCLAFELGISTIIEGDARGADQMAGDWITEGEWGLADLHILKADWTQYGKSAGYRRNEEMVELLDKDNDMVVAFWDGVSKGTMHTVDLARERHITTILVTN